MSYLIRKNEDKEEVESSIPLTPYQLLKIRKKMIQEANIDAILNPDGLGKDRLAKVADFPRVQYELGKVNDYWDYASFFVEAFEIFQPFTNGNDYSAVMSVVMYLGMNDIHLTVSKDQIVEAYANRTSLKDFAEFLRANSVLMKRTSH